MSITIEESKQIKEDFPLMVSKLKKDPATILASLTEEKCDLIHMIFGICGEVGELLDAESQEHKKEELGDLCFYVEGLFQILCIRDIAKNPDRLMEIISIDEQIDILDKMETKGIEFSLHFFSSELLDVIKKHVVYCKPLDAALVKYNLAALLACIAEFGLKNKIGLVETMKANLNKLLKGKNARYASGTYSDQQAQDRADKKEGE